MVDLKVRKFGNSPGVVLAKEVINRPLTKDGQPLFQIEAADGSYRPTPYDPTFEQKMAKAEDIIGRFTASEEDAARAVLRLAASALDEAGYAEGGKWGRGFGRMNLATDEPGSTRIRHSDNGLGLRLDSAGCRYFRNNADIDEWSQAVGIEGSRSGKEPIRGWNYDRFRLE